MHREHEAQLQRPEPIEVVPPAGEVQEIARQSARSLFRSRRGMSLVEVMVVIAIILTLMGVLGFGVMQIFQTSQVQTTILTMNKVNDRVQIYMLRKKKPPTGSDALREIFGGEEPPTDAWGNPFIFVTPGPNGLEYDIISLGADGREGGTGNNADIKFSEERGH